MDDFVFFFILYSKSTVKVNVNVKQRHFEYHLVKRDLLNYLQRFHSVLYVKRCKDIPPRVRIKFKNFFDGKNWSKSKKKFYF